MRGPSMNLFVSALATAATFFAAATAGALVTITATGVPCGQIAPGDLITLFVDTSYPGDLVNLPNGQTEEAVGQSFWVGYCREPGTAVLMGVGLAGLAAFGRSESHETWSSSTKRRVGSGRFGSSRSSRRSDARLRARPDSHFPAVASLTFRSRPGGCST